MSYSITLKFVANRSSVRITGASPGGGVAEFSLAPDHPNVLVRAVAHEFMTSGTSAGTITVTAA